MFEEDKVEVQYLRAPTSRVFTEIALIAAEGSAESF